MSYRTVYEKDSIKIQVDPNKVVGVAIKRDDSGYSITLSFERTDAIKVRGQA